jgi:signal transduction histidine kinase
MRERLKLVRGELFIESHSMRGTSVLARAPVRRS